jgi:hypothetical protein
MRTTFGSLFGHVLRTGQPELERSSCNGTKSPRDEVTREERCSFPVGTDRPASRRPAALDRCQSLSALFCRAGCRLQCTLRTQIQIRVPDVHVQSHLLTRRLFGSSLLHRELARTVCLARSPRAACQTRAAPPSPRGTRGYHPPSRRLRGGCGASRRTRFARALRASLVPCPPDPSRMCPSPCLLGTALTHS